MEGTKEADGAGSGGEARGRFLSGLVALSLPSLLLSTDPESAYAPLELGNASVR